ncbi:MAG: hypothetical protein ABI972_11855 [Acidobacteriota bacterium]
MREADHLRQEMEFQLSLLRLMTVPHQAAARERAAKPEGEEQLERLFHLAAAGYSN